MPPNLEDSADEPRPADEHGEDNPFNYSSVKEVFTVHRRHDRPGGGCDAKRRDRIGSGLCFSNERGLVSLMKMDSRFIVDVRSSSLSFCSSSSSPAWMKDYRTY